MSGRPPSPLHILYLINGLGTGGAERSLIDLLPGLEERGVDVKVACLYRRADGVQEEAARRTEILFLPALSWSGRVREVRRLLRKLDPDVIHTTLFESDVVGRLAAIGIDIGVLSSLVNTSYDQARLSTDPNLSRFRLAGARFLDGFTARHLNTHFHAITEVAKQSAVKHLHILPNEVTVIRRGRDLRRLGELTRRRREEVRRRMGMRETDEIVLTLGRQEYQKGHIYLLEAAAQLKSTRPNLKVLIAGRAGNASNQLGRAVDRLGLAGIVTFLGHRQDVGDLLAAADLFCFPSIYEGMGGAVIEAMAMGVPIVASDIPAMREVVGDAGVLVPPGAAERLGSAIGEVLDDPLVKKTITELAKERVRERFDLEQVADEMAALYHTVAELRSRQSHR